MWFSYVCVSYYTPYVVLSTHVLFILLAGLTINGGEMWCICMCASARTQARLLVMYKNQ